MKDLERLMNKVIALEREIENLKAQSSVGQMSPDVSVFQLDFTHQHPLAGISNLSKLAGILLTYASEVLNVDEANIDHDALTNFAANEHVVLPGTIAAVISDMLDEDNMATDSDTQVASQQSIKAYTDAIASGSTNLDGGFSDSSYSGVTAIDGGDAT